LIKSAFLTVSVLLLLCAGLPLGAQSSGGASLASELERLEKSVQTPAQKNSALVSLGQLYRLSGNRERAAQAYADAARADPAQLDAASLLEAAKLYISLGEYEQAEAGITAVLAANGASETILSGARLLRAELEAFKSEDIRPLAALAADTAYAARRSGIYYTLWRLSGDAAWRAKLLAEYPQTPEALAAAADAGDTAGLTGVTLAASPQWLLYPGREALTLSAPAVSPAASPPAAPAAPAASTVAASAAAILQTGLFGKEDNAKSMADRLSTAGFTPHIIRRQVNGNEYWAVTVPNASDINRTIMELKNAGFEAFPVFE
jgi:tetratricopeptide (TPR) repeat protein